MWILVLFVRLRRWNSLKRSFEFIFGFKLIFTNKFCVIFQIICLFDLLGVCFFITYNFVKVFL